MLFFLVKAWQELFPCSFSCTAQHCHLVSARGVEQLQLLLVENSFLGMIAAEMPLKPFIFLMDFQKTLQKSILKIVISPRMFESLFGCFGIVCLHFL